MDSSNRKRFRVRALARVVVPVPEHHLAEVGEVVALQGADARALVLAGHAAQVDPPFASATGGYYFDRRFPVASGDAAEPPSGGDSDLT